MWTDYKDFLVNTGLAFLQAGVSIYIKTQAQVYIWGRMLNFLKTDRQKNTLALFATVFFAAGYLWQSQTDNIYFQYFWQFLNWFSPAILFYVLVGFRLFSRMDTFQDRKFAKDKIEKDRKK